MRAPVDYCDLPQVSPASLMLIMKEMIAAGRGLVLLRDICDDDLREVENAVWDKLEGTPAEKVSALLRFRCVITVFAGARLRQLFLQRGLALMVPAMAVAAKMRLNAQWGFSPQKFLRDLLARVDESDRRSVALRAYRPPQAQVGIA